MHRNRRAQSLALVLLLIAAPAVASAGSEETWPLFHDVLAYQSTLPCRETWQHGGSAELTYTMTFDRRGQLLQRREDGSGASKRYRYQRGRIVRIEGEDSSSKFVSTVRYSRHGRASIKTRTTTTQEALFRSPTAKTSVFEITWKHEGASTAKATPIVDGGAAAPDVLHFKGGRLISIDLAVGDVMSPTYDVQGRMTTMTTSHAGKANAVVRYTYDDDGRLVSEEFDNKLDGIVEQTRSYEYSCK